MHDFAIKHSINSTWLHFGFIDAFYNHEMELLYDLKRFPVILHFYEGELVKKDYRFNSDILPHIDMEIKFLHTIGTILPTENEFKEIDENLYTIFVNTNPGEELHFDVTDSSRTTFLFKLAETIATLPKDEYNLVGITFKNMK